MDIDRGKFVLAVLAVLFQFVWSVGSVSGQTDALKHKLNIIVGPSIPVGKYSNTSTVSGGFAKTGFGGGVEFVTEPMRNIEVGGVAFISSHGLDEQAYENYFQNNLSDWEYSIESAAWVHSYVLASGGFYVTVSPDIEVFARGYGGLMVGSRPELRIKEGEEIIATLEPSTAATLGYGAGVGARINKIEISGRLFSGKAEHPAYVMGADVSTLTISGKQWTSVLQLTLGLVVF